MRRIINWLFYLLFFPILLKPTPWMDFALESFLQSRLTSSRPIGLPSLSFTIRKAKRMWKDLKFSLDVSKLVLPGLHEPQTYGLEELRVVKWHLENPEYPWIFIYPVGHESFELYKYYGYLVQLDFFKLIGEEGISPKLIKLLKPCKFDLNLKGLKAPIRCLVCLDELQNLEKRLEKLNQENSYKVAIQVDDLEELRADLLERLNNLFLPLTAEQVHYLNFSPWIRARKRSWTMVTNLIRWVKKLNLSRACLVAGSSHLKSLIEACEKHEINYAVLLPVRWDFQWLKEYELKIGVEGNEASIHIFPVYWIGKLGKEPFCRVLGIVSTTEKTALKKLEERGTFFLAPYGWPWHEEQIDKLKKLIRTESELEIDEEQLKIKYRKAREKWEKVYEEEVYCYLIISKDKKPHCYVPIYSLTDLPPFEETSYNSSFIGIYHLFCPEQVFWKSKVERTDLEKLLEFSDKIADQLYFTNFTYQVNWTKERINRLKDKFSKKALKLAKKYLKGN